MLMVELHNYPVDELSYVSSGELLGPEELDDFNHHQHGSPLTQCAGKPQNIGMYGKREAFWHVHSIYQELVSCRVPPFQGSLANCCS